MPIDFLRGEETFLCSSYKRQTIKKYPNDNAVGEGINGDPEG